MHFHIPEFIDPENWSANSQYLNAVDFSVWGALQQKLYRYDSLEVPRRWLSKVHAVKLLGSCKSGHSKLSDRPTIKLLTMVIRAQDGRAEFRPNWNVYNISINCEL